MRTPFALAALLAATALAAAQERPKDPDVIPPRYGVAFRPKAYAQGTPKQALESVIAAADRGEFAYAVAHLLDPAFVDTRLADRAKQYEPGIETELVRLRETQRKDPATATPETRVPDDDIGFRARVAQDAKVAAFRQLVRDVQEKLTDDPEVLKDLRRFNREGMFPADGTADTAKVTLPDVKDRAVFLKKSGDRWFVENRQAEEKAPEPKKE